MLGGLAVLASAGVVVPATVLGVVVASAFLTIDHFLLGLLLVCLAAARWATNLTRFARSRPLHTTTATGIGVPLADKSSLGAAGAASFSLAVGSGGGSLGVETGRDGSSSPDDSGAEVRCLTVTLGRSPLGEANTILLCECANLFNTSRHF